MAYPLIIIGAGASHDYSKSSNIPPPTTKDLVDNSHLDRELLKKYPIVSNLLSDIESAVNIHGKGFEQALNETKERFGHIAEIQAQLVALQFYLQELFEKISSRFEKINNYKILQQHITTYSGGKACVASFNYDSLFEDSIVGKHWGRMDDYVNGNLKVIKLHGSHNWSYIWNKDAIHFSDEYNSGFDYATKNPTFLNSLHSKHTNPYHNDELLNENYFKFPALAIPLPMKQDMAICPQTHIDILKQEMSLVDKVLIIGWQAADDYLLNLMKDNINQGVKFIVVSKEKDSADKIAQKVSTSTGLHGKGISGGFSIFIGDDKCHDFLSEKLQILP